MDAGDAWANLDAFEEAKAKAEDLHTMVTAFVANSETALALATLKEQTGSNKHLLGADPTQAGSRNIGGVPLYVSPSVADDTVWGISKPHSIFVLRQYASVVTDTSVYFTSDRVAVRATLRVSFGFTYPAAVVKVNITP